MELLHALVPLLGVVVGALLTGAGSLLRARAERRRQIALALFDLLEFRHHVVGIELMLTEIRKRAQLPPEFFPVLRNFIDAIFPVEPTLHTRYEEAVSILAAADPVFAFYLRSKTIMPRVLSTLRSFASQGGVSPDSIEALEQQLTSLVIPALNETACALAKQYSLWSWWRVRRVIALSSTLPAEVQPLLAQIQALSKEQAKDEPAAG